MLSPTARPEPALKELQLIEGDAFTELARLPSEHFHLAISDVPYGIGLADWDVLHANTNSALGGASPAQRAMGRPFARRGKPINGWSLADRKIPYEYYEWCGGWAAELYRLLKPGASAFIFAGRRFAHRCTTAMEDAGFNVRDLLASTRPTAPHRAQRLSVVFERRGDLAASAEWKGWRLGNLRPVSEPIIWCFKPYAYTIADNVLEHGVGAFNDAALRSMVGSSDNTFDVGYDDRDIPRHHPAQKPVRLFSTLIEMVTLPGQAVIDPFAGTGTTGVACRMLDRSAVLIENDPDMIAIARARLDHRIAHDPKQLPLAL